MLPKRAASACAGKADMATRGPSRRLVTPERTLLLWYSTLYRVGACTVGEAPRSIRRQARDSVAYNPLPMASLRDLTRSYRPVNGRLHYGDVKIDGTFGPAETPA